MKYNTQQTSDNGKGIEIERCPHDIANPYTMVRNELIRDASISPNCRWLLIYLLSNDERKWTIRISQIVNHLKGHLGRDSVYKLFDQAIEAGYIQRLNYMEGNFKRSKYIISEIPKFKKILPCTETQDAGGPYTEKPDALERTSEERTSEERTSIPELLLSLPETPSVLETCKESESFENKDLILQDKEGKTLKVTVSEIFRRFCSTDFTTEEIKQSIRIARENADIPIGDPFAYLIGIMKRLRKKDKLPPKKCRKNAQKQPATDETEKKHTGIGKKIPVDWWAK